MDAGKRIYYVYTGECFIQQTIGFDFANAACRRKASPYLFHVGWVH